MYLEIMAPGIFAKSMQSDTNEISDTVILTKRVRNVTAMAKMVPAPASGLQSNEIMNHFRA
jgi:hypothetical protein